MADLITINVDGKDVQVPPKTQLIEALRQNAAVDTPDFCYHPDLKVAGAASMDVHEKSHDFSREVWDYLQAKAGIKPDGTMAHEQ